MMSNDDCDTIFFDPKYTNITDYIYDDTYFFFGSDSPHFLIPHPPTRLQLYASFCFSKTKSMSFFGFLS